MSHSLSSTNKREKQKPILNEDELKSLERNDDYNIIKKWKDFCLNTLILIIILLLILASWTIVTDEKLRLDLTAKIVDNISGIIFYVITMIGLQVIAKRN